MGAKKREPRRELLAIRLTAKELARVAAVAERKGLPVSVYVRQLLHFDCQRELDMREPDSFGWELPSASGID